MTNTLNSGERIDDLQYKGLKIIQNPKGFCFGMDAVLISSFAKIKKGTVVADLGCGTGIISILLSKKTQASSIIGVEIQSDAADMAERSIRMNSIQDRVRIINADIKEVPLLLGRSSMDAVVTNPPYRTCGCGIINPDDVKAVARHEIMCTLEDIIRTTKDILKPGGKLFMVHRPDRLADIMWSLRNYKLEPKKLRFVHPRIGTAPNLILIEALRGGNAYLKVEKPLYIYEGNEYSQEIKEIYNS